jgi:ketosteroid isomerase-like protein
MKERLAVSVLVLLLGCGDAAPAGQISDDPVAVESAIRSLEERERLAVLNQDALALEGLWAESFMVNSPLNQIAPNRSVVLDLLRQGLVHYATFERRIEQVRLDGDVAIVMGGETVQPVGNSALAGQTLQRRFTHVWKQEEGSWRLIARHANNMISP